MAFKPRKPEVKRIEAYIATPAYDGRVLTDYAISLGETCQIATIAGINIITAIVRNGAFIDLARNHCARMFLESDATHLFFIDADLKWEARAVIGLVTADLPICAGAYRKRQEKEEYPIIVWEKEGGGLDVDARGFIACKRVATGFLCIRRDVIQAMWDKAFDEGRVIRNDTTDPETGETIERDPPVAELFYTYRTPEGKYVGEDFAFCKDYVEQFGKPIPVYPDFDFTHGERFSGNWLKAMEREIKKMQDSETSSAA